MNLKKAALFCTLYMFTVSYSEDKQNVITSITKGQNMLSIGQKLNFNEFTETESGLLYKTIKKGSDKKAYPGEIVTVHYTGYLLDTDNIVGKKFDSSVDREQYFQFLLGAGQVIKGWDISLADMKIGEKRIIILPPHLAYGPHGAGGIIKPNATLIFEVELFEAQ